MKNFSRHVCVRFFGSFILLLTIAISQVSQAQTVNLTFLEALQKAKENHINVFVAREKVRQSVAQMHEAESTLLPHINGDMSEMRQTRNLEAQGIRFPGMNRLVGPFNTFDARLRVTQNLLDISSVALFEYARDGKRLALEQEKQMEAESIALVASLYINAQRADDRQKLGETLLKRDSEAYTLAREQLNLGLGSRVDVTEKKAGLDESKNRLVQLKAEAQKTTIDLAEALNFPPNTKLTYPLHQAEVAFPMPTDDAVHASVKQNPEVLAHEKELAMAKANQKVAVTSFFPKVTGAADYGLSGTSANNTEKTYSYGAQLSVPLMEGGLKVAQLQKAKSEVRESESLFNDSQNKMEARALKAREDWQAAKSFVTAAKADALHATSVYNLARQKKDSGMGSVFAVTTSQAELALANDKLGEAIVSERLAKLNLIYTMGQITEMLSVLEKQK